MEKTLIQKIAAITGELGAISKDRKKDSQLTYGYQGIDDVVNALNPLLAKYEIAILEEVISLETSDISVETKYGAKQGVRASVQMAYHVTDGKTTIVTHGAAIKIDYSDKSVTQAMSMAYKYAMIRLFAIRTKDTLDPDEFTADHYQPVSELAKAKQENKPQPTPKTSAELLAEFTAHLYQFIDVSEWGLFSKDEKNKLYLGYNTAANKEGYLRAELAKFQPFYNLKLLK